MTFSYWIKTDVENQYRNAIIDDGKSLDRNEISCHLRENGIVFVKYAGLNADWPGLVAHEFGSLLDKKWHHVVGIYDGTEIFLYIDGQLVKSKLTTGFMEPSKRPVCIGANSFTKKDRFTGLMDDIRIYNYALSEAEVIGLYAGKEPEERER